jgi:hypothetical protein
MAKIISGLFGLPTELLLLIVKESRPDGFESLMLTCKKLYLTGSGLIHEHNFCKTWGPKNWPTAGSNVNWTPPGTYMSTENPPQFFQRLLDEPASRRDWLLLYTTAVHIAYDVHFSSIDTEMTIISRIRTDWSDLGTSLIGIIKKTPILLDSFKTAEKVLLLLQGHGSQGLTGVDELKDIQGLYATLILLLLPNITRISSDDHTQVLPKTCIQMLSQLISQNPHHHYFQNLERLDIMNRGDGREVHFDILAPFISLASLKSLKVVSLNCYDRRTMQPISYDWPAGMVKRSSLEQLVLRASITSPEELSVLLTHLGSLKSLILEFKPMREVRSFKLSQDQRHQVKQMEYQSIGELPADELYDDSYFETHIWPPPLRVEDHLRCILAQYRQQLRHLVIGITSPATAPWMAYKQKIIHFKDFVNLTHLEVNIRILQPSNKFMMIGREIRLLPRSLTEILPSSIQVARVIADGWIDYPVLDALLLNIPAKRESLSMLRNVKFRVAEDYKKMMSSPRKPSPRLANRSKEELSMLLPWREELEVVGISLDTEVVPYFYSRADPVEQWND